MLALHAGSGVSLANSSESCRLWHHTAMPGPTARSSRREPLLPRSAPRALRFVSCSPATPLEDGFSLKLLSTTVSAWVPLSTSTFSSRRAHLSCSLSRSRMAVHPGVKMPKVLSCGRRIASGLSQLVKGRAPCLGRKTCLHVVRVRMGEARGIRSASRETLVPYF